MASGARRSEEEGRRPSKQLSIAASKLTKTERERMKRRFERFAGRTPPGDKLSIEDFVSVPELSGNPLMLRVFQILDTDGDGEITWPEFEKAIEVMRAASEDGNETGRRKLAFRVYDVDDDGVISRKDLRTTLLLVAGDKLKDDKLDDVVQAIIEEHDKDGDGALSYAEFQPLLSSIDIKARFTIRL